MSSRLLDVGAILEAAQAETGLDDYGDDTLPDRVGRAVEEIRKAGVGEPGQREALSIFQRLLTTRLQFFEDRKRHPLASERIERPLIATGEPRSGTTLLHALLSVDPGARALRFWEVTYPSPPPGLAGPGDPRRARSDEEWRQLNASLPRWLAAHPYNDMLGDGLPECERAWDFDFRSLGPTVWWRVGMAPRMGLPSDARAQYRLHKLMLQNCQYARPQRYWVLKGFHAPRLAALFESYPDARVIWVHRDPVQNIASRIAMAGDFEETLGGRVDWKEQAALQLTAVRAACRAALSSPYLDDPRVLHVRYSDCVADPIGLIARFYEHGDVRFTREAEAAMRDYLRENKPDRHGTFRYSTDLIGADLEQLHSEFAPYRERFGLGIEERD
jgi:hypothetical protein